MDFKRKRIRVLVDAWSMIAQGKVKTREEVIELLKKLYEENGVEPLRGASKPADLYEKDLMSLYIIGKWGLGLDKDLPLEVFERIFTVESKYEKAVEVLIKYEDPHEVRDKVTRILSQLDGPIMARILRFAFTLHYYGFLDRRDFEKALRNAYKAFPELEDTIRRFAKFYIAYRIGEELAKGSVKNKLELDVLRNTVALEVGIPKAVPKLGYIIDVAKVFFTLPKKILQLKDKKS
ncbi:MAG: hypothetical protein DRO12_01590 [Thermoprotei archaeon]|nr:MAG: hypothetical protein DRO12_01590 [Thermoprotei archaeon]